jgi:EmrB/QacA subfamily drug resistance transporter
MTAGSAIPGAAAPTPLPPDAAPPLCDSPAADMGHPRRWAILAVLSTVAFMAQLDFFIVNVALAGIGTDFHGSSLSALSWMLSAYAIVFASVLVPAGRIADLWGRKKVLLGGVVVFTLASLVCALAPSLAVLIGGRAVQAVGAAMIVPTSLGLLYPSFPRGQHTLVVGIWAGVAAVAGSAGPPLGGVLVSVSWRWIFLINLPIGLAAVIAGVILLPEVRQPVGSRLPDALSAVSLFAAVAVLVLATVQGPQWGWADGRTVALFVAAVLAAALTVQRTLRAPAPIIEKCLFESTPFTAATIAALLFFTGFAVFLLGSALYLQDVWHFSPLHTGIALAPAPVTSIAFATCAGPIAARFGRTLPAVVGTSLMAVAALYWIVAVHETPHYSAMLPGLIIMGISGGLSQAPMFAAASTLAADRATTGSAVLNMSRQVGTAIGVAVLVALTAMSESTAGYDHAWIVQAATGMLAAVALLIGAAAVHNTIHPSPRPEVTP